MQTQSAKPEPGQQAQLQPYSAPQLTRYGQVTDATGASAVKSGKGVEHSSSWKIRT